MPQKRTETAQNDKITVQRCKSIVWGKNELKSNKIKIKPLSVNQAFKGRRFKTDAYKSYCIELSYLLPNKIDIPAPPFEIYFKFGLSSVNADGDNPVKPTQDIIAKKYGFNDKLIKRWVIEVENVAKGSEYIEFNIKSLKKL